MPIRHPVLGARIFTRSCGPAMWFVSRGRQKKHASGVRCACRRALCIPAYACARGVRECSTCTRSRPRRRPCRLCNGVPLGSAILARPTRRSVFVSRHEGPTISQATMNSYPIPRAMYVSVCPEPAIFGPGIRCTKRGGERGVAVGRSQYPALRYQVTYRSPGAVIDEVDRGSVVQWLRLEKSVSGRRIATVTDLLKKSLLVQYQRIHGEPPSGLAWPRLRSAGVRTGPLPGSAGCPVSLIPGAGSTAWPYGSRRVPIPTWCSACGRLPGPVRRLVGAGLNVTVRPWGGEERPRAAHPARWTKDSSTRWATAFPAIPRATRSAHPCRDRPLVCARGPPGAGGVPRGTPSARSWCSGPGAGRGAPSQPAKSALLACRSRIRRVGHGARW